LQDDWKYYAAGFFKKLQKFGGELSPFSTGIGWIYVREVTVN
jgi:hypothetical protein